MSDYVIITYVYGVYSNTYDPSNVNQFVLTRTRYGGYKNCANQCLREIIVQMYIHPFVNIKAIT